MRRSPLESLHASRGARLAAGAPSALPLTYGDVPAEYAAGAGAALLLDATERGALLVTGSDAPDFLHRILANRVRELAVGEGARNLLLTSKGKVEHLFDLVRTEQGFAISTPPNGAPALAASLDRYLFGERVVLEDATDRHAPIELVGPAANDVVERLLGAVPDLARGHAARIDVDGAPVTLTRVAVAGSLGYRIDAGPERAARMWDAALAAGARAGGRVAADSLRVEAGQAEAIADVDDNVYPQEARLEDAFSLSKGCYIGQEVVAKIDTYGGLNKRLVLVALDHDDPVARGTRLIGKDDATGEERELGLVTSWAYGFVRDGGIALAYAKRRHQRVGTRFTLRAPDGAALAGTAEIVTMPQRTGALAPSGEFEGR